MKLANQICLLAGITSLSAAEEWKKKEWAAGEERPIAVRYEGAATDQQVLDEVAVFFNAWGQAKSKGSSDPMHKPLVGDEEFFKLIKPGVLGADFDALVEKGEYVAAKQALLEYFQKKYPRADKKTPNNYSKKVADLAVKHFFRGNGSYPESFRGVKIDWDSLAVVDGKVVQDREWILQYHRATWVPHLASTYEATRDEKYAREFIYQVQSYAVNNFPITKKSPAQIRRGMELAGRVRGLRLSLERFVHSPSFDADMLVSLLYSIDYQTNKIRESYAAVGNHLLADLNGVIDSAIALPELTKSDEWLDEVLDRYPKLINIEINPDGVNRELVYSYHTGFMGDFYHFKAKLVKHGLEDRLSANYDEMLEKMFDAFVYQMYPDRTDCQFGDAWKKNAGKVNHAIGRMHMRYYPDNPFYQFVASHGVEGAARYPSKAFKDSGFYFMRSDWSTDAVFMPVKANKSKAYWHNQPDNGTFGLYAYGRNFMNDSGCYLYESSDPEMKAWRAWFRSTKVHQTMTLNNENLAPNSDLLFWDTKPGLTRLAFENHSYDGMKHRRVVLFVDNRYFIVHDQAIGSAEGDVRIHFQLVPEEVNMDAENMMVETTLGSGPNLQVVHAITPGSAVLEEEDGWISYKNTQKQARPAWSVKVNKKANESPEFLTLLLPRREGETFEVPQVSLKQAEGEYHFEITSEGETRSVVVPVKPVTQ